MTKLLYAGNFGSFSWKAAERATRLNPLLAEAELVPALDPPLAIQKLWADEADYAVIPVFNHNLGGGIPSSLEGFEKVGLAVPKTSTHWLEDFLEMHKAQIVGLPIPLHIEFAIHALPTVAPQDLTRLAAYDMAAQQCLKGLARMVGRPLEIISYSDTAKGAYDLQQVSLDSAYADPEAQKLFPLEQTGVLGPTWCEELFGLKTVYHEVQDNPQGNLTTFVVLRKPIQL